MVPTSLQPDQEPQRWDDHVCVYETVLEPFTLQFADAPIVGDRAAAVRERFVQNLRSAIGCGAESA